MAWVVYCGTWFRGGLFFSKVGCLWFGFVAAVHGSGCFLLGGGPFFTTVGVYGLGCLVRQMVLLVWLGGGWIFGKVGCFWFELVGVAHRSVGLVGVDGFLASLGVYGLICSVGLVGGGRCFGEFGVYGLVWLVWHIVQLVYFDAG